MIIHDFSATNKDLLFGDFNFITGDRVDVQCLVIGHSYEEIQFEQIIGPENQFLWPEIGSVPQKATAPKIEALLTSGAYDVFNEQDIDQILETKTKTISISNPDVPAQTFQKSSFTANNEFHIDVEDTNFWEKILPKTTVADDNQSC